MNRQSKAFVADDRNLGGRTQICELLHNHQSSLHRIKPVVCIRPPYPHVNQGKQPRSYAEGVSKRLNLLVGIVYDPKYAFVRATYRTIAGLKKGIIDRSQPRTFHLIEKLSANKKNNNFNVVEHIKNMRSLQTRMNRIEIGNVCSSNRVIDGGQKEESVRPHRPPEFVLQTEGGVTVVFR
jgi:hypothetical protein